MVLRRARTDFSGSGPAVAMTRAGLALQKILLSMALGIASDHSKAEGVEDASH